jgi:hypothetical protein
VQSLGSGGVSAATDCPTCPPDSDHTGTCVEPFAQVTSDGFPVARRKFVATRRIGVLPKAAAVQAMAKIQTVDFFMLNLLHLQ